jgi:hypothetical protein
VDSDTESLKNGNSSPLTVRIICRRTVFDPYSVIKYVITSFLFKMSRNCGKKLTMVSDPHSLYADPDPDFFTNADPDPNPILDPVSDPNAGRKLTHFLRVKFSVLCFH